MPTFTQGGQASNQFRVLPVYAIAKDMEFTLAHTGADFHAWNDCNSQLSPHCDGVGNAGHNVVVCDGQRRDPCFVGKPEYFGW